MTVEQLNTVEVPKTELAETYFSDGLKEKERYESIVEMMKLSASYRSGNIDYRVESRGVVVWQRSTDTGIFCSTNLVSEMSLFTMYVDYNKTEARVELIIY